MRLHANSFRRHLMLGSALAASTIALASPLEAQSVSHSPISAAGETVVLSDQSQEHNAITASVVAPHFDVQGDANLASIVIGDKSLGASAAANKASSELALSPLVSGASPIATRLASGTAGTSGSAAVLIATRQAAEDEHITSRIAGEATKAQIGGAMGSVAASSITVTGTSADASALANDASSQLSLASAQALPGVGVLIDQSATGTLVAAKQKSGVRISADSVRASALDLSGNLQRALAQGNTWANTMQASGGSAAAQVSAGRPSLVPPGSSGAEVNASIAVLSNQLFSGAIEAHNRGGYDVQVAGAADSSALGVKSNGLIAAAFGNRSANSLDLEIDGIAASPIPGGAVAQVTNVQMSDMGEVHARSHGAPHIVVGGAATSLTASIDKSAILALATANQAEGNELRVHGGTLGSQAIVIGGGVDDFPPRPPVGTAFVSADGTMSLTAPFGVQNAQSNLAATAASLKAGLAVIDTGNVSSSNLSASGNQIDAASAGNRASSALELQATSIATSADINTRQIEKANVAAYAGKTGDPAGAVIIARSAAGSELRIADNRLAASASANSAANSLSAAASSLTNASGHLDAAAGALAGGVGAAAQFALANLQSAQGPEHGPVTIYANAQGKFGIAVSGAADGSSFEVSGNKQSASATGNGADSRLALSAATIGAAGATAPGTALSNVQEGNVDAVAVSHMVLEAPGNSARSEARIAGNANSAGATINLGQSALSIDAAVIGRLSGTAGTNPSVFGPSTIKGDHVLASEQSADGYASATAETEAVLAHSGAITDSDLALRANGTEASASANDANSSVIVAGGSATGAAAGLLSTQRSTAVVAANARQTLGAYSSSEASSGYAQDDNWVAATASGNRASNALELTGMAAPSAGSASSSGALNGTIGAAVLASDQNNSGLVTALAMSDSAPVGIFGELNGVRVDIANNSLQAAAFGNRADNAMTLGAAGGGLASGIISNMQVNAADISAVANNAGQTAGTFAMNSGRLSIGGNSVTAQAFGNFAANSVRTGH